MKYSCNVLKIILQRQNNTFIMRIEKMVDRVKEFLLWVYIMPGLFTLPVWDRKQKHPVKSYTGKLIHDRY